MLLDGSSALMEEWTSRVRAQWAGHRAAASAGGDGGAWLDGDAAEALACDAAMAPIVTGDVNPAALDDLVRLCVQLDRLRHHSADDDTSSPDTGTPSTSTGTSAPAPAPASVTGAHTIDTTLAWEALERAIIGKAVDLLSGPGGLASFLRRRQLGARLGGPSLPLDIGYAETIPAGTATPSPSATATASGPGDATSPPRRARCTTPSTRRTAARPAFETAFYFAGSTIRW